MTALLVNEDLDSNRTLRNKLRAYLDAVDRGDQAADKHPDFFDTDTHVDRVCAVSDIIKDFFGQRPDYYNKRGLGKRKPFEAIKVGDAHFKLRRTALAEKNAKLYGPLLALGNVEVKVENGHLIVRVF